MTRCDILSSEVSTVENHTEAHITVHAIIATAMQTMEKKFCDGMQKINCTKYYELFLQSFSTTVQDTSVRKRTHSFNSSMDANGDVEQLTLQIRNYSMAVSYTHLTLPTKA